MKLHLKEERTYRFSDNPQALAEAIVKKGKPAYLITFNSTKEPMFSIEDVGIR
ncbi:MAG TPA: hypothetical protein VNI77_09485 [Nitrososphaera sp.]|nr:hypothetical protein [Nitrososphaera sp.]